RFDLVLCGGFVTTSLSWAVFAIGPIIAAMPEHRTETWTALVGILIGWTLVACAPFMRGRVENRRTALVDLIVVLVLALCFVWGCSRALGIGLPDLQPEGHAAPRYLTITLALLALVNLVAAIGFGNRFRVRGEDLDRWLTLGATLMLFASLNLVFSPLTGTAVVSQGDFLRLVAYSVLI